MANGVESAVSPNSRIYLLGAAATAVQLGWGIRAFRKGYDGDSRFMPLKAFAIASLFVGALATASFTTLTAFGVHSVEDAKEVGTNIRTAVGVQPRITRED